jgi:hypothetical protein
MDHHIDNLLGSQKKRGQGFYGDDACNNQIKVDYWRGKRVLSTRLAGDGQHGKRGGAGDDTR